MATPNLTKQEKSMTRNVLNTLKSARAFLALAAGVTFFTAASGFAQEVTTTPGPAAAPAGSGGGQAEVERVIVTGSNIPTAEETGPNPVDTYRPQDIEKLGIRRARDLPESIPQEAGGTVNQNIGNGGDGTTQINLRGILPK